MARHIMTLTCDDRPGIVATVSTALVHVSANIVENQQYSDLGTDLFFMRTLFDADTAAENRIAQQQARALLARVDVIF